MKNLSILLIGLILFSSCSSVPVCKNGIDQTELRLITLEAEYKALKQRVIDDDKFNEGKIFALEKYLQIRFAEYGDGYGGMYGHACPNSKGSCYPDWYLIIK